MPGSTIGDGSVIGANSLVSGAIPPNSLAVGSPAKVIRRAPEFPLTISAERRGELIAGMMAEFDRYVTHAGIVISEANPFRLYARDHTVYRLLWVHESSVLSDAALAGGDTVFTDSALSESVIALLRSRGVHWLDLSGRSRSRAGSALTEELAQFLGRYGIRLARDG